MKSKKGFMLGEYTMKIIIAVLCIILLLYLLFSLYSSFTDKQNFSKAEATLNRLFEIMSDAKKKSPEPVQVSLVNPSLWKLIIYNGVERPEACVKNCICLCEDIRIRDRLKLFWAPDQIEKCNIRGVCKGLEDKVNDFEPIILVASIDVKYVDGVYTIEKIPS